MGDVSLGQCPVCRMLLERIEGRPHGLALHHCRDPEGDVMALVSAAAMKPDLTMEDAATAGVRVMLHQCMHGDAFDARGYGEMMAGMARLKDSGADGADAAALERWFNQDAEEGEE